MKKSKSWPLSRRKELEMLQTLLNEVASLNNGNNIIGRIQRCVKIADKLNQYSRSRTRASFMRFGWLPIFNRVVDV